MLKWFAFEKCFQDVDKMIRFLWYQKNSVENFHVKCCEQFLKMSKSSVNIACLAELGRYPLLYNIIVAILSYWKRISKCCSNVLVQDAVLVHKNAWQSKKTICLSEYYPQYM